MLSLFAATLFVNALLLFWVQPLFGKMVLPLLGGSPSVWTTCMLFFQAALLAGYAYSHAGERWLGIRRQAFAHILLVWLPLFILPIDVNQAGAPPSGHQPIAWLLGVMTSTVGLPFAVVATTAPLLQRWFSACDRSSDPYRLYAASNAGSLIALLAFPVILEPIVPLGSQQAIWTWVYAMVALLLSVCSIAVLRAGSTTSPSSVDQVPMADEAPPSGSVRLRWLALSFAPSSLMLGVTTYLSTDVAAVPLLWVLPLALYLLTFIIAFGAYSEPMHRVAARVLPLVLLPLVMILLMQGVLLLSLAGAGRTGSVGPSHNVSERATRAGTGSATCEARWGRSTSCDHARTTSRGHTHRRADRLAAAPVYEVPRLPVYSTMNRPVPTRSVAYASPR